MQNIDLEAISDKSKGLPDCWHIDSQGKSNPEALQKHFKLPRSFRTDKKLLDILLGRNARLSRFVAALLHYRNLGTPIMLIGDGAGSPEAHALARYDEGWHLRDEADLTEFSRIEEGQQRQMLSDLLAQREHKDFRHHQLRLQALANRANTTVERAFELMLKCAAESWLRARNELANWTRLEEADRSLLAEAIFCGFTFFGKRALEEAAAIEPSVLTYYRTFRGLPAEAVEKPSPQSPSKELDESGANAAPSHPQALGNEVVMPSAQVAVATVSVVEGQLPMPGTLRQLYELIGEIGLEAQRVGGSDPEPALRIKGILDQHLQRLIELSERMSTAEAAVLVDRYCDGLLAVTTALGFAHSDQRDLIPALRSAWKVAVITALEKGQPRTWFEMTLTERRNLQDFVDRFAIENGRISAAQSEIEEIRTQIAEAKYTARTALKARETKKLNEVSDAQRELESIRVEAAHSLVPDGRTLDDLMEDQAALTDWDFDAETLNPDAVKSLKSVVDALGGEPIVREGGKRDDELPQTAQTAHEDGRGSTVSVPVESLVQTTLLDSATTGEVAVVPTEDPKPDAQADAHSEIVDLSLTTEMPAAQDAVVTGSVVREEGLAQGAGDDIAWDRTDEDDGVESYPEIEAFEDVPAEPKVLGVEDALRHLQYSESREEALKAFRLAYDQYAEVPTGLAESMAVHWLTAGHLNVAYQMLRDANESTLLGGRVLDASLLRSAFHGINFWPKDRDSLSYTQRDLNLVNHTDLEEQLARKPIGKLVPYLLVCATLQPALFAGSETLAPTLLKVAVDYFDGPLRQLISTTAEFAMRGGRVDLDLLRNEDAQEAHLAAARLQEQVNAWVDINAQRTTRWHALRVALKLCPTEPVIGEAIEAIRAGERGDSIAVRTFVERYRAHADSRALLDELVARIRADGQTDNIDSTAYTSFCQQIDSLVAIAQAWLLEVIPADVRPNETKEFIKKFHTQLDRSIAMLLSHPGSADLEHRAGSALLLNALQCLQGEIRLDSHSTWKFEQTDATFRLPETLARLEIGDVGVDLRFEWYAMRLLSTNWLGDMVELAARHKAHWAQLLLLRQLEGLGSKLDGEIDATIASIAGIRAGHKQDIDQFRNLSVQAMSADLITEDEHLSNMDIADDWLEKLSSLKPFIDVSFIGDAINSRTRGLEKLLNSNASELDEELNQALLTIRTKVGPDAVPDGWDVRARSALERRSLTVVRELINQLQDHINRNARLLESSQHENVDLKTFIQIEPELFELLHTHQNPREAGDRVIQEQPGGLDYSVQKAAFRDTIATLMEWGGKGPNKRSTLDRKTYESIVGVLRFLGFTEEYPQGIPDVLLDCEYSPGGGFRRLKIRVQRPALPKGFPLFEGDVSSSTPLNVILVHGNWSLAGLAELVERHGLPDRAVLLVGEPLSGEERNAFANFCRDRKCTIFLLDPVVLSYLATSAHTQAALEMFLRVTAAWTFFNPYTKGDARMPAPPEMRFGRENAIASLVEPRGAALVYGGRQLGKTTLLNAAVQEFKKRDPARNHAFYLRMDGQFQHAVEREEMDVEKRVLEHLAKKLIEAKLLSQNSDVSLDGRLHAEFQREGATRVLFCLDEIDSVLNKDARKDFQLVRALAALVNHPNQRFRVVFAGLNNVNRFRTYPNVPLEQLGSPLPVEILPAPDARSLILQPLTSLGYRFEEGELVDRIMAFTNRHPSLLHIFCSELVEQLGRDRSSSAGLRVIRQADIESIESNSDVRRLSGERLNMTLNLDRRYAVVMNGLMDEYGKAIGNFTVKQALDVARGLVPEEFEQMSESGFEGLLRELVGLGVLREVDRFNHQYALRNQSILQLIGTPDDIHHNLQDAIRNLQNQAQDALTCHPCRTDLIPSPLTLHDEKQVLIANSPDGAPKYSVSIVMGTPALGLSTKALEDSFRGIIEYQFGKTLSKNDIKTIPNAETYELKRFAEVIDTAIENWAMSSPSVILVSLEDCPSINRINDLLSVANEKAARATRLRNPLRVVFLLGARAMWSWHSHPWLTAAPGEIGGHVELNRWTQPACEALLEQQGLGVTPEMARNLYEATEGWHASLLKFIEIRNKKKRDAGSLQDLSKDFASLATLPARAFENFVQQTGMTSLAWSMPLACALHTFDALSEFSTEDLEAAIEFVGDEHAEHIAPEQAGNVVRWWTSLRVIEANNKEASARAGKEGKVTYRFTHALQRAVREYASQLSPAIEGTPT
ncbi:hypothetical protein PQQ65_32195 [Paraburkholderia strydomiana]|uniref:hypothetical protein n=1 Tax=Paraburkholderia strydomiana TaxID=1245417 RepID=UPI0038BB8C36